VRRAPFIVLGIALAALFAWQSCLALLSEPAHPRAGWMDDDYPLEPGLVWVYKGGLGVQVVRRVGPWAAHFPSGDDDIGPEWAQMEYELPLLGKRVLFMRRSPDGVVAWRGEREQLILRFPMKPGDSWTIDFPDEDLAECTVLEPESIDVLKKRVHASKLRIVRTNRKSGKKATDYEWYARGIGLARMEVTFGIKATFELERFEHAK
jgi:hypothetical protein